MMQLYCEPISRNPEARPLVFTWDPETGSLGGRDAGLVLEMAVPRSMIAAHPVPWGARLGTRPLRSKRDMALIIGTDWVVPEMLRPFYPKPPPEPQALAPDGTPVGTLTF